MYIYNVYIRCVYEYIHIIHPIKLPFVLVEHLEIHRIPMVIYHYRKISWEHSGTFAMSWYNVGPPIVMFGLKAPATIVICLP